MTQRVLVVGLGVSGRSAGASLVAAGNDVTLVDDRDTDDLRAAADAVGARFVGAPDVATLAALVAEADLVVVSPGVPRRHPVHDLAVAAGVDVVGDIELAARGARAPIVAITGTNGKTTVTTLVAMMLVESGRRAVAAGNIGMPLLDAVQADLDVLVVEASSFQLAATTSFHPTVAVWLNLADDHLDWHGDRAHYVASKAKVFANQGADDLAVANADDPVTLTAARAGRARVETFGTGGDWTVTDGWLTGPPGRIAALSSLPRRLPHDIANALAATAAAVGAGAPVSACAAVLGRFLGLPHRVELVHQSGGVCWYDDSKATTPASVLAALEGFASAVLIAGGQNKQLDLGVLRAAAPGLRHVVAIGAAADDIVAAFRGAVPVTVAADMDEAVAAAAAAARAGDAVLLSPGCASFDRYRSYAERGDDFTRAARALPVVSAR